MSWCYRDGSSKGIARSHVRTQVEEEFTMTVRLVGCIGVKKKKNIAFSLIFIRTVVLFALNVLFCFWWLWFSLSPRTYNVTALSTSVNCKIGAICEVWDWGRGGRAGTASKNLVKNQTAAF